jgi:adenylyl cyclase CyaB, putative
VTLTGWTGTLTNEVRPAEGGTMALEVEIKFRATDRTAVAEKLASLGATTIGQEHHCDCYFAPPHRDFAKTDEALRIRRTDALGWITYKGPKLDATTKTRREIEAPIDPEAADRLAEILNALSFKAVREVRKTRLISSLAYQGFPVSAAIDEVQGLDGVFVELEIHAEDDELDDARRAVLALGEEMGLHDAERRSYLEMILAAGAK